jgi:hypothetical protein
MVPKISKQELLLTLKEMKLSRLHFQIQEDLGLEKRDATQQSVLKMLTIQTTLGLKMTCHIGQPTTAE